MSWITPFGYRRMYDKKEKRLRFEHVWVWEEHHKRKVPKGFVVHHKDENKLNNDIKNLELLSETEHKFLHAGYRYLDGKWIKQCSDCQEWKSLKDYYKPVGKRVAMSICKKCHIKRVTLNRKKRNDSKLSQ